MPRNQVRVCGAWTHEEAREASPESGRSAFLDRVGLPIDCRYLLYVGSAEIDAPDETSFFRRLISHLRRSDEPRMKDLAVLVRPQEDAEEHWRSLDLGRMGSVAILPAERQDQALDSELGLYCRALQFCSGVMANDPSVWIDAAAAGRPSFCPTPRNPCSGEFEARRFHGFLDAESGLVWHARGIEALTRLLYRVMFHDPAAGLRHSTGWLDRFARPFGPEQRAADLVLAGLRETAAIQLPPSPVVKIEAMAQACLSRLYRGQRDVQRP